MADELALIEPDQPAQPLSLFGTTDPVEVLDKATKVANALADLLNKKQLFATISGRKYVTVDGWETLGAMLGVFAQIEWARPIEGGWEARAVATAANGRVIGAGEAQCTHAEVTWAKRDAYALRAMAQTRATSRALRGALGFVVKLAGYESTPSEEMPPPPAPDSPPPPPPPLNRPIPPSAPTGAPTGTPASARTPQQIADEARKHVRSPQAGYDDTTAVCPVCGRAEALRPAGQVPRFCAKAEGGCGAPPRGSAFEVISFGQWKERR